MTIKEEETSPIPESVESRAINGSEYNVNENDEIDTVDMAKLAKKQLYSKEGSGYTSTEPNDQDVLLGRGKPVSTIYQRNGDNNNISKWNLQHNHILTPLCFLCLHSFFFGTPNFCFL
jgi:hypothetical protein